MLRDKRVIALFILPAVVLFVAFIPVPLVSSIVLSFYKWDLLSPPKFIGFTNFIRMFTKDAVFVRSIGNTFEYLGLSILMQIPLAYFLAIFLTRGTPGDKAFRNIIFLPVMLSGTAVALMFYFIYHPQTGVLNTVIRLFGDPGFSFPWLMNASTAMVAVCFAVAWQWVGYHMVIFITGITGIPNDIIEAAKIDGANTLQVVLHVITPLMKPVLNVSLVLITTSSLKAFDSIYVLTGGGPMHATEVMASNMYQRAFHSLEYGYASAIGLTLFVLCVVTSTIWSRVFRTDNMGGEV